MEAEKISIYEKAKELNIPMDRHESDLYLKATETAKKLVDEYEFKCNVKMFKSQIDSTLWFDIPFAYDPFWSKKIVY
mgnify:CR=1 FL=1